MQGNLISAPKPMDSGPRSAMVLSENDLLSSREQDSAPMLHTLVHKVSSSFQDPSWPALSKHPHIAT